MKKYGYKNISNRDEFQTHSQNNGDHQFSYNSGKHITNQGFINWGEQNQWGVPGQTKYEVKNIEDILKAAENVSKGV